MHYIIDGHNLIGKMPDISLKDPDDEVKLVLRLKSWTAESKKRQVTLFFDGGTLGSHLNRLSSSNLKVIFATSGKTADSLIIHHLRQLKNPRESTLITSDHEIINAAKSLRIRTMLSEEFIERMGFVFKEPEEKTKKRETAVFPPPPEKSDNPTVNEAEIQEWLDLFGPAPEPPKPKTKPHQTAPPAASPPAQKQVKSRPLRTPKTDENAHLDADEIDAWLNLFKSDDT
jgi:uncharacterized protein